MMAWMGSRGIERSVGWRVRGVGELDVKLRKVDTRCNEKTFYFDNGSL